MINHHYNKLCKAIQDLEEICGPETHDEYIKMLQAAKAEIDKRLNNVYSKAIKTKFGFTTRDEILEFFKDSCGPHLDPDIESFTNEDLKERYELTKFELSSMFLTVYHYAKKEGLK